MMDSSGFIATVSERRPDALICRELIAEQHIPVFVSLGVIIEAHRLLLFKEGTDTANLFLEEVYGGTTQLIRPEEEDERKARELIHKYADLSLTLCDALTSAIMLRLGIVKVFTYDHRHFGAIGFITIPPLFV